MVALAVGIAPNVPGFLAQASGGAIAVPQMFSDLYTYAWFVGLLVAGVVYVSLTSFIRSIPARSRTRITDGITEQ